MNYNLLDEPWIPVRRKSGARDEIAPWQIIDDHDDSDPIVAVAAPRPDASAALTEFLVGLVQTAATPASQGQWGKWMQRPPTAQELRERLEPLRDAFEMLGDGPRFMQDLEPEFGNLKPAEQLLFDAPGDNTLKNNKDIFFKRPDAFCLSPRAAAMALIVRQNYNTGAGAGYRTGLRGGGPLVTLVLGDTLWETIWLNVQTATAFERLEPVTGPSPDVFPWMAPTRTSEKGKPAVTALDIHPLGVFWACSGRYRLVFEEADDDVRCSITGEPAPVVARSCHVTNYGNNYNGSFTHPLSPYRIKGSDTFFRSGTEITGAGATYRSWAGVAVADADAARQPAPTVTAYYDQRRGRALERATPRLWCFGYDLDNASAVAWNDFTLPLLGGEDEARREGLELESIAWVHAAELAYSTLLGQLRRALYGRPPKKRGARWDLPKGTSLRGSNLDAELAGRFWNATQSDFFAEMYHLEHHAPERDELLTMRQRWVGVLRTRCLELFDELIGVEQFEHLDPRAIIVARRELGFYVSAGNKKMRDALPLPDPDKE